MPCADRRILAILFAVCALALLLAGYRPKQASRAHIYYCWNPAIAMALPCRYVKSERDV